MNKFEAFRKWVQEQGQDIKSVLAFEDWGKVRLLDDAPDGEVFFMIQDNRLAPTLIEDLKDYIEEKSDQELADYKGYLEEYWASPLHDPNFFTE